MGDIAEFITKFHHLKGVTLREKKKSLHSLLVDYKNVDSDVLNSISQQLTPSSYLEETLKIQFLIYFKRSNDLLTFLLTGNEIGACRIIRQSWFVKELMDRFTPEQFVRDLFCQLSLSVRTKILKRVLIYIKNEEKIQKLFEILHETYGWKVAEVLLYGCSEEKIKEILTNCNTPLSATKLKQLYDKSPSLITFYFGLLKSDDNNIDDYKWRSFFDYVKIKDPIYFTELTEKFKIYKRNFGRQTTKKFVEAKRNELINDPDKYSRYLRNDALVRKLGKDFPSFFKNGLPKNISDFNYCAVKSLLKYYAKRGQYQLYIKSFQEHYNKNLWDNVEYMDERLIEYILDKEERENWIKKFENRVNILKYQPRSHIAMCSMTEAKMDFEEDYQLSDEMAIADRKTIFNTLISTCKLNQDYDALLNILKFFCERHRNSDVTILYNFLRTLYQELDMKKLTEAHWKYINEIITIQLFKKQKLFFPIFVEYIKFLYFQKKPIEELVLKLIKELPSIVEFKYDNDEFEKVMLLLFIKLLPQVDDKKNNVTVQLTLSVRNWNQKHINDPICLYDQEHIMKFFEKLKEVEKVDAQTMKAFSYLICRQIESTDTTNLDEIYWTNFKILNNKSINTWFLKYKPEILKKHLDKIGIIMKDKNINLIRMLKKYEHIDIPKEITNLCLIELENAEPSKRERVIKILLHFMPQENFANFLQTYTPKVDKIDVASGDEDTRKTYEIQCALAKHLKSRINLEKELPEFLNYCRGDVLGSALASLYSIFCRIPEKKLYFALDELSKKPVSVRKHSIFLSCLILPIDKVLLKYKNVQASDKHVSARQNMFLSCYKYFLQNSVPECWPIMKEYISQISKDQKDLLKLLVDVHKVPKTHRAMYTELVWELLSKLKKENEKIDGNMRTLLNHIGKTDVALLREEFCYGIIDDKLFDLEKCSISEEVFDLTKHFILYGGGSDRKLNIVFKCLNNFKKKFWMDSEKKVDALKIINNFCFEILGDLLKEDAEKIDKNFPNHFAEAWKKEFSLEETFEEYLFINFVMIKFQSHDNSDSFAKEMNKSFSDALEKYGVLIIDNFKNFLSSFLRLVLKDKDYNLQVLKFLDTFLESNSSLEHFALVVDLIPLERIPEEGQVIYKKLFDKLVAKDQIIQMRLYGKLKTSSSFYY